MKNLLKLTPKTYMFGLLIGLAIIGIFQIGYKFVYIQLVLAVVTAVILDLIFGYLKNKKFVFPSSAFITGMIIALVLPPDTDWCIPVITVTIAILQKYIIRYKGKHIFNPANFGLLSSMFIFSIYPSWWGQNSWPLIVLVGAFICCRMKRLKVPIIFMAFLTVLFALNNLITARSLNNPLLLINIFFVFIMLVEPKTMPTTKVGLNIYAVLVALMSFIFFRLIPQYDFSILALAVGNIFIPFVNKIGCCKI